MGIGGIAIRTGVPAKTIDGYEYGGLETPEVLAAFLVSPDVEAMIAAFSPAV